MFTVTPDDLARILVDFGFPAPAVGFAELQRYDDPDAGRVRLIARAETPDGRSLVIRFKHEPEAPEALIEAQSRFAALLSSHGIETPRVYAADGKYVKSYPIGGYDVLVTAEDFAPGQLQTVDAETARDTGRLLARMHDIAEAADAHVAGEVIFDPLRENDLFSFREFDACREALEAADAAMYRDVVQRYESCMERLRMLENAPRYATQGDLSDCNLYRTSDGRLGVFDFNLCGDSVPFFDAVMQAVFVARLMDYPDELAGRPEEVILPAFLAGYDSIRPFTAAERALYPYLYALLDAFWLVDINRTLRHAIDTGEKEAIRECLSDIRRRVSHRPEMPIPDA